MSIDTVIFDSYVRPYSYDVCQGTFITELLYARMRLGRY